MFRLGVQSRVVYWTTFSKVQQEFGGFLNGFKKCTIVMDRWTTVAGELVLAWPVVTEDGQVRLLDLYSSPVTATGEQLSQDILERIRQVEGMCAEKSLFGLTTDNAPVCANARRLVVEPYGKGLIAGRQFMRQG
ncbi:hypothetical protein NDN08_004103 [Rhodosorus marinus]|uniref:DUF659 domain-containing protein n=1 Tax=Rhodosorus marinus TaxID=101924 RepID=A0AAV8UIP4_9RHOD|nr:hypothetical protein NDN08_004103 [Rhodosorus marinus]